MDKVARVFVNEHPSPEAIHAHMAAHPIPRPSPAYDPAALWLFKTPSGRPVIVAIGWWGGDEGEDEPAAAGIEAQNASYAGFTRFTKAKEFTWRPLTAEGLPVEVPVEARARARKAAR